MADTGHNRIAEFSSDGGSAARPRGTRGPGPDSAWPAGQSAVRATIDAASYDSGNKTRDADVTSATLLDAKAFPEITFTGSGTRKAGTDWVLSGSVTAHGITQPVLLRITQARLDGEAARFVATATLDRTAFGVTKKKGMVGAAVHLAIDAVAVR